MKNIIRVPEEIPSTSVTACCVCGGKCEVVYNDDPDRCVTGMEEQFCWFCLVRRLEGKNKRMVNGIGGVDESC
jgi:hypothetical protein